MSVLSKSIKLNPYVLSATECRKFILKYFPKADVVLLDSKYKLISWDEWREIDKEIYQITKKRYIREYFDCDDRSYITKYFTQQIFGISQFIVHGHCYDLEGKWLFGHFWNTRIADNKLYFYEPIGDKWTEVEAGKKVIMKNREYRPITLEF